MIDQPFLSEKMDISASLSDFFEEDSESSTLVNHALHEANLVLKEESEEYSIVTQMKAVIERLTKERDDLATRYRDQAQIQNAQYSAFQQQLEDLAAKQKAFEEQNPLVNERISEIRRVVESYSFSHSRLNSLRTKPIHSLSLKEFFLYRMDEIVCDHKSQRDTVFAQVDELRKVADELSNRLSSERSESEILLRKYRTIAEQSRRERDAANQRSEMCEREAEKAHNDLQEMKTLITSAKKFAEENKELLIKVRKLESAYEETKSIAESSIKNEREYSDKLINEKKRADLTELDKQFLTKQLTEITVRKESLEEKSVELRQQLRELKIENEELSQKLIVLQQTGHFEENKHQSFENEIERRIQLTIKERFESEERLHLQMQNQMKDAQRTNEKVLNELKNKQMECERLRIESENAKTEQSKVQRENEKAKKKIELLISEYYSLKTQLEKKTTELEVFMNTKTKSTENDISQKGLVEENEQLKKELSEVHSNYDSVLKKVEALENEKKLRSLPNKTLVSIISKNEKKIKALEFSVEEFQEELRSRDTKEQALKNEIASLRLSVSDLFQKYSQPGMVSLSDSEPPPKHEFSIQPVPQWYQTIKAKQK